MSARDKILNAVKTNKPSFRPLPPVRISGEVLSKEEMIAGFCEVLVSVLHGTVVRAADYKTIDAHLLKREWQYSGRLFNAVPELNTANQEWFAGSSHSLEDVDLSVIPGIMGVAENAAIWVEENTFPTRVVPFICQHLAIVLKASSIVSNMHEAYQNIQKRNHTGYGAFISGPSKTADIEQSLVIGAHGPRSLTVYLLEE